MRHEKPGSKSRPTDHPRRSPSGKQTMAHRLDKFIGIPVRVPTPDNRYGTEYTFTKPYTTFMLNYS